MTVSDINADFCIEIDFQRGAPSSPSRIFRTMTDLIESFQEIDNAMVQSIDVKIEPVLILEDLETGSIRAWLRSAIEALDDDALKTGEWKKQVGIYLVQAKYIMINFLEGKTEVSDRKQIDGLERRLLEAAKETEVLRIPMYTPVGTSQITKSLQGISEAVAHLEEGDRATYRTKDEEASFNMEFHISPESIEQILTKETISSDQEMILKVKKPDYLGESMWDFRHEGRTIQAKILDETWLERFQSREEDVRPGDALRGKIKIHVAYGFDEEVVGMRYEVVEVTEIITAKPSEQSPLF